MVRIVPYAAITYMSNESYKDYFKRRDPDGKLSHVYRFCSGSMAGLTASFSTYGLEVCPLPSFTAFCSQHVLSICENIKFYCLIFAVFER